VCTHGSSGWQAVVVPDTPAAPPAGPTYVPVPDIAEALDIPVTRVHQLIRERQVLAVRQAGVLRVPAEFILDGEVVRGLAGTITLLTDTGFSDAEIIDWLWAADDSLPGRPIDALRANRGTEIRRRAQAAGF
jgi:hypothetical protein